VGKAARAQSVPQERIHQLMLEHARGGRRVVRLKGGDPFVFGGGGEELEFLAAHRIPFEVVPGITAALACGAYAGVALTHRDHAQSLRLVTAHCGESIDSLDWVSLAQERQTVAFYMGVAGLATIGDPLRRQGRDATTPVADHRNALAGPARHACDARRARGPRGLRGIQSPALLVVGEVAALAGRLHWFGNAPAPLGNPAQGRVRPSGSGPGDLGEQRPATTRKVSITAEREVARLRESRSSACFRRSVSAQSGAMRQRPRRFSNSCPG